MFGVQLDLLENSDSASAGYRLICMVRASRAFVERHRKARQPMLWNLTCGRPSLTPKTQPNGDVSRALVRFFGDQLDLLGKKLVQLALDTV